MKRTIKKAEIDKIFDDPKMTNQADVCIALYRLAFPGDQWDHIKLIHDWPKAGKELALYVMGRFMAFDREHHPNVMNGGLWMNKGWSHVDNDDLKPWELSTENCKVEYEHGEKAA